MPLRRLADYSGLLIWACTLVFGFGVSYQQITQVKNELKSQKAHVLKYEELYTDVKILKMHRGYQIEWQAEFMATFKQLVSEIRDTNAEVLRQSYQLQAIEKELKKGN
jgi:Iap family predicted aminopeptidase